MSAVQCPPSILAGVGPLRCAVFLPVRLIALAAAAFAIVLRRILLRSPSLRLPCVVTFALHQLRPMSCCSCHFAPPAWSVCPCSGASRGLQKYVAPDYKNLSKAYVHLTNYSLNKVRSGCFKLPRSRCGPDKMAFALCCCVLVDCVLPVRYLALHAAVPFHLPMCCARPSVSVGLWC